MQSLTKVGYVIFLISSSLSNSATMIWQDHTHQLSIVQISTIQNPVFKNLQLCYEAEFAPITQTPMTPRGDYDQRELSSHWSHNPDLYLFYVETIPAGFCVVNEHSMINEEKKNVHDIAEFYITPIFRKKQYGSLFAQHILQLYPGGWEIRQLPELEKTARLFWLKVIGKLPVTNFQEIIDHPNWHGFIQQFHLSK